MKILVAVVALALTTGAYADTKSDDAARSKMIQAGIKVCSTKGYKTVGEKDACVSEYTKKANNVYPARGSVEYAEQHYAGLSKSAAESKLIDLQSEWKTAQNGGYFSARRTPGVLSKKAVVQEGWWIQTHILGARQTQDDPWFIECSEGAKTLNIVRRCPLGKGGAK
ncbi:hypothetical protein LZ023_40785 (plasmid) [Pseudomonas silvicola]|nr:hypothetical protein LZ023_41060 [Pseudomonas silvicola]WAH62272.1 hypothetical protein LZ023_40785 [Pseudomonas silvicola]